MPRTLNMQPVQPDAALGAIVGTEPLQRTEITKRIWAYIKAHNLQAPDDRRSICADMALLPIFGGVPRITMFQLTKCVNNHVARVVTES